MKTCARLSLLLFGLCGALCACDDEGDDDAGADDDQSPPDDDDDNDDAGPDDDDDNNDDDDNDDDNNDTDLPDGIYVALTGDNENPGTPTQPKRTIEAGLAAALQLGLPVFVAEGEYREALVVRTSLYGGYRASDWARDIDAYPTIINADAEIAVAVENLSAGELYLEGFTIRGETDDELAQVIGVDVVAGLVRLSRNRIESPAGPSGLVTVISTGVQIGGRDRVHIERSEIHAGPVDGPNAATSCGITIRGGPARVEVRNSKITSGAVTGVSQALAAGACIGAMGTEVVLHANEIAGGEAEGWLAFSDGVEIIFGYVTLIGNVIRGGPAAGDFFAGISAGVHTRDFAPFPVIVGNTIAGGAAPISLALELEEGGTVVNNVLIGGAAAMLTGNSTDSLALWYNDLFCLGPGCVPLVYYYQGLPYHVRHVNACDWPGCAAAGGNIAADPGFVGDDPHLPAGSPCVDAGVDPSPWTNEPFVILDIDGNVRPQLFGWDIGADELLE